MVGEITLADALERIDASGPKEREKGLADLKHILRNNTKFDSLDDVSFHRIYEILFLVTVGEQSTYLKAKTPTTRTAAENRLSACASALRLAIEVGVWTVKLKTVRSVLDHVIQTLRLPSGEFCEPIALDYAKCLRFLLSYQPHVEHLSQMEREAAAVFCLECIQNAESELAEDEAIPAAELASMAGTINGLSYRSSRSHFKESGGSQGGRSLAKQIVEVMVACLSLLTAAPNATIGKHSSDLLEALIKLLRNTTVGGRSHQDAFATINHVLAWTRTEDIEATKKATIKIIRLIRNYWSLKSTSTPKDEMLITLLYLRPYLLSAMDLDDDVALRSELCGALEVMRNEYGTRKERDQLHMDELRLIYNDTTTKYASEIKIGIFRLRCARIRAEANWCTIYLLATFCSALTNQIEEDASSDDDDDEISQRPRKRQRLTNELDDTLTLSGNGAISARLCAFQILAFLAQQKEFTVKQLVKAIDKLSSSAAEENTSISSWALLALASFASQSTSTESHLSSRWISVWQLATRAMSNASTCRAACYLIRLMLQLRLVPQQNVSELVQIMTVSMDLNGPSLLADSVAHLLTYVAKTSQQLNPALSSGTAESILSWLFRNFLPSKFDDRTYANQHLLFEPGDVLGLIASCLCQLPHGPNNPQFPVWDSLGQIWVACEEQHDLAAYLLLLPKAGVVIHKDIQVAQQTSHSFSLSRPACEAILLTHLISELYRAEETWSSMIREKPTSLSLDMFTSFCKVLGVAACIANCYSFRDTRRQTQLQRQVNDLRKALAEFIPSPNCAQDKVDSMLVTFSGSCSDLICERQTDRSACEKLLCETIAHGMESRRSCRETNGKDDEEDEMELDEAYDSQDSRRGNQSTAMYELQNENAMKFSNVALRSSLTLYAIAISVQCNGSTAMQSGTSSAQVVDYILSLPEGSILASASVVSNLPRLGIDLTAKDCYRLLDYCSEKILPSYHYERSEVAVGAILDILSSLAPVWTNLGYDALFSLGTDMYDWYTTTALSGGVLSPNVQRRVASLLLQLCHIDPDYGRDSDVPSVRTSLFKLLQLGSVTVLFHLANRISTIFGLFVLSNHEAMFDDLQTSLPDESGWIEGLAMRLLFLSKLASAWHSLLRQCVYYIFETAGSVKDSLKHAARSIAELAACLNFSSSQKLFQLFAPQLLHTWLESHTVTSLPFSIFQYDSLNALITQNQNEITAQLLVQGNDEGMHVVMNAVKSSSRELVVRSFAKCAAYCIGSDVSRPNSDPNEASSESRLRKLLGNKEEYLNLVNGQFAAVIGHFYLSLQQEDVHDKWIDKKPAYLAAAKALDEIKTFSHSERELPTCQQPSFKSKHLLDQIARLCRRTGHDPSQPWEPSSFSLAARILLDSVNEALGPLHMCTVVRRLRLLISTAGDVATSGFPLEMLIHALRPLLSDSQCADDAMGVLQYLFHHGQHYLKTNLSFLYGTVILMVLQIGKHSGTRHDSTTQESQHKATVQKMQNMQLWLVNYIQKCHPSNGSPASNSYASFAKSLAHVNLPGNARKGSPESLLLLLLLDQYVSDEALLRKADRDEALTLLSSNFELPPSLAEDCLENDAESAKFAEKIWHAIQIPNVSESFIAWAAGVLGRAYASCGRRPMSKSVVDRRSALANSMQYAGVAKSQASIARLLCESLFSRNHLEASLADHTLRSIVFSFKEAEDALTFEQMLPNAIVPAIAGGTCGYEPYSSSSNSSEPVKVNYLRRLLQPSPETTLETWTRTLSLGLCRYASDVAILPGLVAALKGNDGLSIELLPCIIHILLVTELEREPVLRTELSASIAAHIGDSNDTFRAKRQYLLKLLLYLRSQALPGENTNADRLRWVDVDWLAASDAAIKCQMATTALLFAESASPLDHGGRRSSSRASLSQMTVDKVPQELLLSIFKGLDEPDSFYGIEQAASLDSVLDKLDFEGDGFKSLMFRSAQTDTHLRHSHRLSHADAAGMVRSLSVLNLNSLSFALLSRGFDTSSAEGLLNSASRLQQWDIAPLEPTAVVTSNCFAAFQELSRATASRAMESRLRTILIEHTMPMTRIERANKVPHDWFSTLATLVEIGEVINCAGVSSTWNRMKSRESWMQMSRFEHFRTILSNRNTVFSVIAKNKTFAAAVGVGLKECRTAEIDSLLHASALARKHGQLQEALIAVSQVNDLISQCREMGLKADAAAQLETASVLWDSNEATASVKMLQEALDAPDPDNQDISVGRSGLLARLGHLLAEARLEKPDEILSKCLKPAIDHLQGCNEGQEAGNVFHEFATFCDKQLQNPGNIEDFNRIMKLRQRKLEELEELERLSKTAKRTGPEKNEYIKDISKAKQWFEIDDADYQRLKRSRDTFMQQSLQNYLLALRASDEHDISILRFFALWLENADIAAANAIVSKYLPAVPSWKFVVLMNQLMSRLEHDNSAFQGSLRALAVRICSNHPHHSLHHLFASTRKPSGRDLAAQSRYEVATIIRKQVNSDPQKGELLRNVFQANNHYNMLANQESDTIKGSKVAVKEVPAAYKMVKTVPDLHVPPATISIPLRPDGDYNDVPTITKFANLVQFMAGLSRPKKMSAYASNGEQYVQLFKSGNDDLRQDAIMEQVFEEVSKMLRNHEATRQRNLHVRTYKVIPLSPRSGIIEFVPNSTSFADFLVPAHERYHPQDYKNSTARAKITAVKDHATEARIKEFRKVCEHLHPVMRHFFFEHFQDPDEWFEKRTAYTRTTATASILGYVLGLGDRHCQNIMLDEKTGEVVHIDLGVAFEAGRVLPVPELVPFRLTRDVVDGMGIAKTEGVFRRCCEFTMDALREDNDSIMTLLNVLRYDPLYTWTVSPLRAKRMQEETGRNGGEAEAAEASSKKKEQEAGEADRALSIVEKKLSKTLSTAATVNELIQQATDERNLATLFSGWAAYF